MAGGYDGDYELPSAAAHLTEVDKGKRVRERDTSRDQHLPDMLAVNQRALADLIYSKNAAETTQSVCHDQARRVFTEYVKRSMFAAAQITQYMNDSAKEKDSQIIAAASQAIFDTTKGHDAATKALNLSLRHGSVPPNDRAYELLSDGDGLIGWSKSDAERYYDIRTMHPGVGEDAISMRLKSWLTNADDGAAQGGVTRRLKEMFDRLKKTVGVQTAQLATYRFVTLEFMFENFKAMANATASHLSHCEVARRVCTGAGIEAVAAREARVAGWACLARFSERGSHSLLGWLCTGSHQQALYFAAVIPLCIMTCGVGVAAIGVTLLVDAFSYLVTLSAGAVYAKRVSSDFDLEKINDLMVEYNALSSTPAYIDNVVLIMEFLAARTYSTPAIEPIGGGGATTRTYASSQCALALVVLAAAVLGS